MVQTRVFDLEERTLTFTKAVILFCKKTTVHVLNQNILEQLLRSASSIGANYREANDALGKRDFLLRLKIARKEAKETVYWLECLTVSSTLNSVELETLGMLKQESQELLMILSSIIRTQK